MRERERRSEGRAKSVPTSSAPAAAPQAPAIDALLAVQRSAGNRAVVQRLLFNDTTKNLVVPTDYANRRIHWDGTYKVDDDQRDTDRTFEEHVKNDETFKGRVIAGLGIGHLNAIKSARPDEIAGAAQGAVEGTMKRSDVPGDRAVHAAMVYQVSTSVSSHNQVLTTWAGYRFPDLGDIESNRRLVPRPAEFLPEAPDLPGADVDLQTVIPNDKDNHKYWTYACVLIALYKTEGIARVKEITGKKVLADNINKAVQALHEHYIKKGVQYDDSSTRPQVMSDWGYRMIFAGESDWAALPGQVALPPGDYIFDITGHTVKVTVLRDISAGTTIDRFADYFRPDSDKNNFNVKESDRQVIAIWKKG